MKARPPERLALLVALAIGLSCGSVLADPWEDALANCVPGAPYDACVHGLEAAGVKLDKTEVASYREASFALKPPFTGMGIRTYANANGRIVQFSFALYLDKGKPRQDMLTWMTKQLGASAKQVRSSTARGAAQDCGADGWGVGWTGSASSQPEVQLELSSPESTSDNDDPEKLKPEDALVKRQGNGLVSMCFILPPKDGSKDFIAAPVLSAAAMKAFLASTKFHGVAALK